MRKKQLICIVLVLSMMLTLLPTSAAASREMDVAEGWARFPGWTSNEDGSVTHTSGDTPMTPKDLFYADEGFHFQTELHIDQADDEMFSTVFKLVIGNNSDEYFYMHVKRSHGDWCAELQFYESEWVTLTCPEGVSGKWVSGMDDTVTITLSRPANSTQFYVSVGSTYGRIVSGNVYYDGMEDFCKASSYRLFVWTEEPETDIFTLSDFSISSCSPTQNEIVAPLTSADVLRTDYLTAEAGTIVAMRLEAGTAGLCSGDFLFQYDDNLLTILPEADATSSGAETVFSGEDGARVLSYAAPKSKVNDFVTVYAKILQNVDSVPVTVLGKNLVAADGSSTSSEDAFLITHGTPEVVVPTLKIKSAFLRIDENINVIYAAEVSAGCTNPYMVFTFQGREIKVTDYTEADGSLCFELSKVVPQCMGDNISATLYAKKDGKTVSDTVEEYSVRTYCENQLAKTDDAALITLLSDLLTYGATAQTYTGYKTDALVTSGLDLTPSTFSTIEAQKATFSGEKSATVDWYSATLGLSNELAMRFTFTAASVDGLSVDVTINGRTQTFNEFESVGDGRYAVTFRGIKATEFDDAVTASFKQGSETIGRTVSYSVNTYISAMQVCGIANLEALVQALYNYGASAKAYSDTIYTAAKQTSTATVQTTSYEKRTLRSVTSGDWIIPDSGWTQEADGIFTATGNEAELVYRQNNKFVFDNPEFFSYDITLTDGTTNNIWLKDLHTPSGWGHYLLRIGNSGNALGMTFQFADNAGWHDAMPEAEVWNPVITHDTLRVRFASGSDFAGIRYSVSDAIDGHTLYQGVLDYHCGTWLCDMSWFSLAVDRPSTISNVKSGVLPMLDSTVTYDTDASAFSAPSDWIAGADDDGTLTFSNNGSGSELVCRQSAKLSFDDVAFLTYDIKLTNGTTHTIWLKDIHNTAGWGHYLLRIANNSGSLGMTFQFADNEGWHDAMPEAEVWNPAITHDTLRIRFAGGDFDGICYSISDAFDGHVLYQGVLSYHCGNWLCDMSWFTLAVNQPSVISHIASGTVDVSEGVLIDETISYETASSHFDAPADWIVGTGEDGTLTYTNSGNGSELIYRQNDKLVFDEATFFTYDIALSSGTTHTIWLKDIHNTAGWGHYLLRVGNNSGSLNMTFQFADSAGWHDTMPEAEVWNPSITHDTLRIRFASGEDFDGIRYSISDAFDGHVLYQGILSYHCADWLCDMSWFTLAVDQPAVISHIASGAIPAAEKIQLDENADYETSAAQFDIPSTWSYTTDDDGYLAFTADGTDNALSYRMDSKIDFDAPVAVTYDVELPTGATHAIWLKDIHNANGWGHYLLRIGNSSGSLGMTFQFADNAGWHDAMPEAEVWDPSITHDTLRIRFETSNDYEGIRYSISDPYTLRVLYQGILTYHCDIWQSDICWFTWAINRQTAISRVAVILPPLETEPAPEGIYEVDDSNFGLGLGWSSGTDDNGLLTMTSTDNAEGSLAQKTRMDVSKDFTIAYNLHLAQDYTEQAIFINNFSRKGYTGTYLLRFKVENGKLSVEAQFNNGRWLNGVIDTKYHIDEAVGPVLRVVLRKQEGVPGIVLSICNAENDLLYYRGVLSYHETEGWTAKQSNITIWRSGETRSITISNVLLDVTVRAIEDVPLTDISIKEPATQYAGTPGILYAEIEPYAATLTSVQWTVNGQNVGTNRALYFTFEEAGDYVVTLTATDKAGTQIRAQRTVTVEPAKSGAVNQFAGDLNADGLANSRDLLLVLGDPDALRPDELARFTGIADVKAAIASDYGVSNQFFHSACDEFLSYMNDTETLPTSFTYGGKDYHGITKDFALNDRTVSEDAGKISVTSVYGHRDGALEVTVEAALYPQSNAYEWTLYFTNNSLSNSAVLKNVNAADFLISGANPVFKSISGDKENSYAPIVTDLLQVSSVVRRSVSGWSTHDAFPYFNIETDNGGYMMALGWTGTWIAEFSAQEDVTHYTGGQYALDTYLEPAEVLRTPLMAFVKYDVRDEDVATNAWRHWYIEQNMPKHIDGSLPEPMCTVTINADVDYGLMNSFLSEEDAIECLKPMVEHGIGANYIWMDAGWHCYCDGNTLPEWFYTGTNTPDATRFENGFADITQYGEENGMKALLWFEPEFVRMPMEGLVKNFGYQEEWGLYVEVDEHTRMATYLSDLTNEDYQKWIIERVAYVLDHAGIELYREDFNRAVGGVWSRQDTENRIGVYENHYVQSMYFYWDTLVDLFPGLLIDSCASGGGRNDLERMRRAIVCHRTDAYNADNDANQSISQSLWKWLPYTNANNGTAASTSSNDTYTLRTGMAPVYKGMHDFRYFDRDDNWALAHQMFDEWTELNPYFYGDYYPVTEWSWGTDSWIGWEFYLAESDSAALQIFRREDSEQSRMTLCLKGLSPRTTYTLADTDGINTITATGAELMAGVEITIPSPRQALVIFVTPQ